MISLEDICDLPIDYDDVQDKFDVKVELNCCTKRTIPLSSITPTLLNKFITYPERVYDEYSVHKPENPEKLNDELKYDLLVIPSGLLGIEYIKSHIFYSPMSRMSDRIRFSTIVEGIQGTTTVLMQKNHASSEHPTVKEGIMVKLNPKDKIGIPEGYFYTFINTGERGSLISRVYKSYSMIDYEDFDTKGLAYFCIRKNAKLELVYNPQFKIIPNIKKSSPEQNHLPDLGLNLDESLYNLTKVNTEMLVELLAD